MTPQQITWGWGNNVTHVNIHSTVYTPIAIAP